MINKTGFIINDLLKKEIYILENKFI